MALNTKACLVRKSILFSSIKISGKMKSRALTKRSKCKYYTKKGRKKWKKVQRFMRFNELQFLLNPMIPTWDCVSLRVHRASQKIPRKDRQKEMNKESASVASNWCVRITKCWRKDIKGHQSSGGSRWRVWGSAPLPPPPPSDLILVWD